MIVRGYSPFARCPADDSFLCNQRWPVELPGDPILRAARTSRLPSPRPADARDAPPPARAVGHSGFRALRMSRGTSSPPRSEPDHVLHYPPTFSPDCDSVTRVWWRLHESVAWNHRCQSTDELLDLTFDWFARGTHFQVETDMYNENLENDITSPFGGRYLVVHPPSRHTVRTSSGGGALWPRSSNCGS